MGSFLTWLGQNFRHFGVPDAVDIIVVALGIYLLLRLVRGTRAVPLIVGSVAVGGVVALTNVLGLEVSHWILVSILQSWVIVLIILFQPELRLLVEQIGRGQYIQWAIPKQPQADVVELVNELVAATRRMSEKRFGALIAIEREVGLNDILRTGRGVGGEVSSELLLTVFHPGSAMHDGGVVVKGNRVAAAMCHFPDASQELPRQYGTRHRAAVGLSEVTDAVVIVVSEETGAVSLAMGGKLRSGLAQEALKNSLLGMLRPASAEATKWFWRREKAAAAGRPAPCETAGDEGVRSGDDDGGEAA